MRPAVYIAEELGELLRSEALQGSRPMGALLGVKSECHPMLLRELIAAEAGDLWVGVERLRW